MGDLNNSISVFDIHFIEQYLRSTILWDLFSFYYVNFQSVNCCQTTYYAAVFHSLKKVNNLIMQNNIANVFEIYMYVNVTGLHDHFNESTFPSCRKSKDYFRKNIATSLKYENIFLYKKGAKIFKKVLFPLFQNLSKWFCFGEPGFPDAESKLQVHSRGFLSCCSHGANFLKNSFCMDRAP